jgi:hypothetical protein
VQAALKDAGVKVCTKTLQTRAKLYPGMSPVKTTRGTMLPHALEEAVYKEMQLMRSIPLPVPRDTVLSMVEAQLSARNDDELWKAWRRGEKSDHHEWYYGFLTRWDCTTDSLMALDDVRALWETSANAFKMYGIWAGMAVERKMADPNPTYDPEVPYCERIIWRKDALDQLGSMDETDVRVDQSKKGRMAEARSVTLCAPGSRKGAHKAERGRKTGIKASSKKGFIEGAKIGRQRAKAVDDGQALSSKSAHKTSFAAGTIGNGNALAPLILSDRPLTLEELQAAPRGTVRVLDRDPESATSGDVIRQRAEYVINSSGGMESKDFVTYFQKIAIPGLQVTPARQGMLGLNGLGQHHTYEACMKAKDAGLGLALRFPHGSRRSQHEDFEHFPYFKPAHAKAKRELQVAKFRKMNAEAEAAGRTPSQAEMRKAAVLTNAESLQAAVAPWEAAFKQSKVVHGWAEEGIVPFTQKLAWDLKKEEEAKGITAPPPPRSSAAVLAALAAAPEAGPSETREARLEAAVQKRLVEMRAAKSAGKATKAKKLKLTSADFFQLEGSCTGEQAERLLFAREVERLASDLFGKEKRVERAATDAQKEETRWTDADELLKALKASDFNFAMRGVTQPALLALLKILNPPDWKPADTKKAALISLVE